MDILFTIILKGFWVNGFHVFVAFQIEIVYFLYPAINCSQGISPCFNNKSISLCGRQNDEICLNVIQRYPLSFPFRSKVYWTELHDQIIPSSSVPMPATICSDQFVRLIEEFAIHLQNELYERVPTIQIIGILKKSLARFAVQIVFVGQIASYECELIMLDYKIWVTI